MRNLFNTLSKMPKIFNACKAAFSAAQSGVNMNDVVNIIATFRGKIDNFIETTSEENYQVRSTLIKNLFFITPDGTTNIPKTWNEFFRILQTGLEKTEADITASGDHEQAASLGRIKYRANLLQDWYKTQDPRLSPLLESLGKINGIHSDMMSLFPDGEHKWEIKGKSVTIEIRRQ